MIRRPPRSTQSRSSAASDVYKRQVRFHDVGDRTAVEVVGKDDFATVAVVNRSNHKIKLASSQKIFDLGSDSGIEVDLGSGKNDQPVAIPVPRNFEIPHI